MSFTIGKKTSSTPIERVEDGTYLARLVQLIDFGVHPQVDFQTGEPRNPAHRLWVVFELPTELINVGGEERPRWQGREYTLSFHEKSGLTALINALDPGGEAKTLTELLGNPCMITIGSTKNNNPKIVNVVGVPKGMTVPPLDNPTRAFNLEDPDLEIFEGLPKWMQDKITSSLNFNDSSLSKVLEGGVSEPSDEVPDYDDDLPF